ncbi:MAG: TonB-dependent receptor plug domain-containing protein, partial [Vitreimonas sp.]
MRNALQAALLTMTSLAALPAAAQEGEIVVTATRAATPSRELPADVTVIDAEAALSRGQTTLSQAIAETPGLGVVPGGGVGQQTSIFAGGANSHHTLVLFDGLRINDPSTPNSSFDAGQDQIHALTRAEIVEGPMSAVFGSDAIGGVINLIPRHGGEGPLNARLATDAGSFGTLSGAAGIDGTLGRFRYALTSEGYATDGHDLVPERMSTHVGDADGADMSALTGVFDLALSNAIALDLLVRHRRARADFDPFLFDASFNEFRADDPNLEISRNDLTLARFGADWAFSDTLSLRATAGGISQEREQRDGGLVTDTFEGQRRFADLTLEWVPGTAGGFEDAAIVAGVFAEREEVDIAQGFGFPPPFFFTFAEQEQQGAFVTAQGRVGHASLTGAARVDVYDGFAATATWRLGASFDVAAAARLHAAYGTSFRAPTLYERFASFGNPSLDPERGESWEIGADASFAAFGQAEGLEAALLYR